MSQLNHASFDILQHPIIFQEPRRFTVQSAWNQHIPFGMLLVELLRPRIIVELGTHSGPSYCAFCQAVKLLKLTTRCYAVDTWTGDRHSMRYRRSVLDDLRSHHDPLYGEFSSLIQSTFDEAVSRFENGSIDLLHIDGLHTYAAVKHDFETWLPKLSDRSVVLFHDSAERKGDFGVYRLWEELAPRYRHFEFQHGHGLGVLLVGGNPPADVDAFISAASNSPDAVRALFHCVGSRLDLQLECNAAPARASRALMQGAGRFRNLASKALTRLRISR